MVIPSVSALNFVSVTPSMGILFPLLRRIEVSTLWSSFFLSFMCFENYILSILNLFSDNYKIFPYKTDFALSEYSLPFTII